MSIEASIRRIIHDDAARAAESIAAQGTVIIAHQLAALASGDMAHAAECERLAGECIALRDDVLRIAAENAP